MNVLVSIAASSLLLLVAVAPVAAHAPMVVEPGNESAATAFVLEDPTLSRAIGATLDAPGEVDWYRMDLRAGDALVVEVTAPDAAGGIPTSFAVLGPGLPDALERRDGRPRDRGGSRRRPGPRGGGRRARGPRWPRLHRLGRRADDRPRGRYLLGRGPRGRGRRDGQVRAGARGPRGVRARGRRRDGRPRRVLQRPVAAGAGAATPSPRTGRTARGRSSVARRARSRGRRRYSVVGGSRGATQLRRHAGSEPVRA